MNEEIPMKKTRFTEAQIMGVLLHPIESIEKARQNCQEVSVIHIRCSPLCTIQVLLAASFRHSRR